MVLCLFEVGYVGGCCRVLALSCLFVGLFACLLWLFGLLALGLLICCWYGFDCGWVFAIVILGCY